jgi:selenocysteine lyase/cysteine desulfurase
MDRRRFLHAVALSGTATALPPDPVARLRPVLDRLAAGAPQAAADDEAFWLGVRQAFTIDANQVNLNSGSVSPAPRVVAEAMARYWTLTNMSPSLYVDELLVPEVELVRQRLAAEFGCDPEELALTRNTSESLLTAQFGLPLARGDEVLITTQDYPRMLMGWEQRVRRDGIVLKTVAIPTPAPSLEALVERVWGAVTPRTRVLHVSHMTYTAGQIFPVRALAELARARGIWSVVDGGHTFGQFPFTWRELGCDVYGTSLHKWLTAPVGNGFLAVRRERIPEIWPLFAAPKAQDADIRKFEQIGTYPLALRTAVTDALAFHQALGAERKAARLRFLRERWMRGIEGVPGVRLLTSYDPAQACALGAFSLAGMGADAVTEALLRRDRIHVRPRFVSGEWEGVRVTPNVFTTVEEVDRLVAAVRRLAAG